MLRRRKEGGVCQSVNSSVSPLWIDATEERSAVLGYRHCYQGGNNLFGEFMCIQIIQSEADSKRVFMKFFERPGEECRFDLESSEGFREKVRCELDPTEG